MSRRKDDFVDGCLAHSWPLLIIFAPVIYVLNFLLENIGVVLVIAAIIGCIALVVSAVSSAAKKREAEEAERQRNLSIVNAPEVKPTLVTIPYTGTFSNKEESSINQQFREYLQKNNAVIEAKAHLEYLSKKETALIALGRTEEVDQLRPQISQARTSLTTSQNQRKVHESKANHMLYRDPEIRAAFTSFAGKLAGSKIELIGDFLQSPMLKSVPLDSGSALIFTPGYVMHYMARNNFIKLYQYNDVSVSTYISTEIVNGNKQPSDEIEHIGYRYETKDGRRDMRYSYENNPSYTFVYRGSATIRCGQSTYEQKFSNKSLTNAFEKSLKDYVALMTGKHKGISDQVLSNDAEFLNADSVSVFMLRRDRAEKLRAAAEKAETEKRERARLEREAAAEAKRKEQRRAEEAKLQEERKKQDLLRNLTIVDGILTSWYGTEKHLVLPVGIVREIGTAFRWKPSLETVELPEGITAIQANAFHGSSAIKRISIPSTVCTIDREAFTGCSSLTDAKLPVGLKSIAPQLFANCTALEELVVPPGVQRISAGAFKGCRALKRLLLSEGITSIDDGAFEGCSALKEIVIPDSVIKLGKDIFSGCTALERIVLGQGITRVPDGCFNNLQKLSNVEVSTSIREIGSRAFKNCQKLKQLRFTANNPMKGFAFEQLVSGVGHPTDCLVSMGITKIGESAFENCFAFVGLDLADGLTTIGDYAFANCRSITSIEIPQSVKSFGRGVFSGCVSLTSVKGANHIEWHRKNTFTGAPWLATQAEDGFVVHNDYLEAYVGAKTSVEIPKGISIVGTCAFNGNESVSSIVLPDGVEVIEELAFANCKHLSVIQIADSVTRIEDNAFSNSRNVIIRCSRGSNASAFRIRNKIAGEYIAKTKPSVSKEKEKPKQRNKVASRLPDLTEDERRMVMQMRREKLAKKAEEQKQPAPLKTTEFSVTAFDARKVSLALLDDLQKITNNIFNLKYIQKEPADDKRESAVYETFVTDASGQIISNIVNISADKSGNDLVHKVTYSLSSHTKFQKNEIYFVILRYKGTDTNVVMKEPCKIVIEFASDFDF